MSNYLPQPLILQWLAVGQLANSFVRSVRLWKLINLIYYDNNKTIPTEFDYSKIRNRLYGAKHPKTDLDTAREITNNCQSPNCICHQTLKDLVFGESDVKQTLWKEQIKVITGFSDSQLEKHLQEYPFAKVHRSIRDDLKQLAKQGWLNKLSPGRYQIIPKQRLPQPPTQDNLSSETLSLSKEFGWSLLHILGSVGFVQPNLASVTNQLWEQLNQPENQSHKLGIAKEPQQRVFLHLDYILSQEKQDRVDNYQEQLEDLWGYSGDGVIQFDYAIAVKSTQVNIVTYPVCLHYMRRAKYLSAYGRDLNGEINWHNFRLDRIVSPRLNILPWGDPQVPKELKQMRHTGELPTSAQVQQELNEAWGFNFYYPKELLIVRFPRDFAQWYVDDTQRHPTFKAIAFADIPPLIKKHISNPQQQENILALLAKGSPKNAYYQGWIRSGDVNVLMRLRDWRPKGEVIAPLSLRNILAKEAAEELAHYR